MEDPVDRRRYPEWQGSHRISESARQELIRHRIVLLPHAHREIEP
jgi:hypothetical protein